MNERIKELAEQAAGTKKYVPPVWQFYDDELEEFAKLIIKKCVEVAYKYDEPKLSGPGLMIGYMIEEHFGNENE